MDDFWTQEELDSYYDSADYAATQGNGGGAGDDFWTQEELDSYYDSADYAATQSATPGNWAGLGDLNDSFLNDLAYGDNGNSPAYSPIEWSPQYDFGSDSILPGKQSSDGGFYSPREWGTEAAATNQATLQSAPPTVFPENMAKSGIYNPDGTLKNAAPGFRSWWSNEGPDGQGGRGSRGSAGAPGYVGGTGPSSPRANAAALQQMIQGYNDAVKRARNAAEKDRNKALQAVAGWKSLINERLAKNPFGAEYRAQTLGVVRDARARQYQAAVEELRQAYAQQGKPLDPRLLTTLRMQMAREENGDLRNLSIDTAGKAYAADTTYVNEIGNTVTALDRILSNTSRQPNPQELAFLSSLLRSAN